MNRDKTIELIYEILYRSIDDNSEYANIYRHVKEMAEDIFDNQQRINERLDKIEEMIKSHAVGVQNVYNEFSKIKDMNEKVSNLIKLIENFDKRKSIENFDLDIKSYPCNTRIKVRIETNFGEIKYAFDYPPRIENQLGESLQFMFDKFLDELYEEHEKRGGKFIGEEGCKEWMDKNGKTIIDKGESFIKK